MWLALAAAPGGGRPAQPPAPPPESIADLRLGSLLHEFTERKHAQLQLLLELGRSGTAKRVAAVQEAAAVAAAAAAAGPRRVVRIVAPGEEQQEDGRGRRKEVSTAALQKERREKEQQKLVEVAASGPQRAQRGASGAADGAVPLLPDEAPTVPSPTAGVAPPPGPRPGAAFSTAVPVRKARQYQRAARQREARAAAASADGADLPADAAASGYRSVISQVERRQQQREQDIRRRWAGSGGLAAWGANANSCLLRLAVRFRSVLISRKAVGFWQLAGWLAVCSCLFGRHLIK